METNTTEQVKNVDNNSTVDNSIVEHLIAELISAKEELMQVKSAVVKEDYSPLYSALALAQSEFTTVQKSENAKVSMKSGGAYSYTYSTLKDILNATLPALNKYGIFFEQYTRTGIEGNKMMMCVMTSLIHSSGLVLERPSAKMEYNSSDPQGTRAIETRLRRYGAATVLGLADSDDEPTYYSNDGQIKAYEEQERLAAAKAEEVRQAKAEEVRLAAAKAEQVRLAEERAEKARQDAEKARQNAEQERQAKAEQERLAAAQAEQIRQAKLEEKRLAEEKAEQVALAKAKAEQIRQAQAERAMIDAEQERQAKAEQERQAKEEQERQAKEEQERQAKEEQERQAKEEQERQANGVQDSDDSRSEGSSGKFDNLTLEQRNELLERGIKAARALGASEDDIIIWRSSPFEGSIEDIKEFVLKAKAGLI